MIIVINHSYLSKERSEVIGHVQETLKSENWRDQQTGNCNEAKKGGRGEGERVLE